MKKTIAHMSIDLQAGQRYVARASISRHVPGTCPVTITNVETCREAKTIHGFKLTEALNFVKEFNHDDSGLDFVGRLWI